MRATSLLTIPALTVNPLVKTTAPAYAPVAPAASGLGGCIWLTCLGCGGGFAAPAENVGALVDCPACPWQGVAGNPF